MIYSVQLVWEVGCVTTSTLGSDSELKIKLPYTQIIVLSSSISSQIIQLPELSSSWSLSFFAFTYTYLSFKETKYIKKSTKLLKVMVCTALNVGSFGIWCYQVTSVTNIFFILGQGEVEQEEWDSQMQNLELWSIPMNVHVHAKKV